MYVKKPHKPYAVPVGLLNWAASSSNLNMKRLVLFLHLKHSRDDGRCDMSFLDGLQTKLGYGDRTFKKHIKWLQDNNWIGQFKKGHSWFYVRKYELICKYVGIVSSHKVILDELPDEKLLRAAAFAYCLRTIKYIHIFNSSHNRKKTITRLNKEGIPCAITYLQKRLKITKSKAYDIIKDATKHQNIISDPQYKIIENVAPDELYFYREYVNALAFVKKMRIEDMVINCVVTRDVTRYDHCFEFVRWFRNGNSKYRGEKVNTGHKPRF